MFLLLQSLIKSNVEPHYPGRKCVRGAVLWRNVVLHGAPTHSMVQNVLLFSCVGCGDLLGPSLLPESPLMNQVSQGPQGNANGG